MQGKVSVGLSTVTGYGVSSAAFVGAVLAYLGGDHSNQTVAIIALGVIGALAFAITNIGRQRQAIAITKYGVPYAPTAVPETAEDPSGYWGAGSTGATSAGYVESSTSSNAGPVVADPSLLADPSDLDGAGDHPVA